MKNKQKVILAFKELINKYENPDGEKFTHWNYCSLCIIFGVDCPNNGHCQDGCPLAYKIVPDNKVFNGCSEFKSYKNMSGVYGKYFRKAVYIISLDWPVPVILDFLNIFQRIKLKYYFNKRAKFFKKYLPIIEEWPESRFTKSGWEYSGDEISRND